jgi:hypothetical protein
MIEHPEGYWDEIVHVDDDGLGYARKDYPAKDYPVGTRVHSLGVTPVLTGVVVEPHESTDHPGEDGPAFEVPVRWDGTTDATWEHTDWLVRA